MEKKQSKTDFKIDIQTAFEIDKQLRVGLADDGLIPEISARDIKLKSVASGDYDITLSLDSSTAAALSELLREGIVGASAAHQANNGDISAIVSKLAKPKDIL